MNDGCNSMLLLSRHQLCASMARCAERHGALGLVLGLAVVSSICEHHNMVTWSVWPQSSIKDSFATHPFVHCKINEYCFTNDFSLRHANTDIRNCYEYMLQRCKLYIQVLVSLGSLLHFFREKKLKVCQWRLLDFFFSKTNLWDATKNISKIFIDIFGMGVSLIGRH